ncbi:MAG: membrane protein insertase YidC, partial [Bauldia sp.]
MTDSRNFIIAIVLSIVVLFGWQYFFATPQIERAKQEQQRTEQLQKQQSGQDQPSATGAAPGTAAPGSPAVDAGASGAASRDAALAQSPRVAIETPRLSGSINLHGARLDDLRLNDFHETVSNASPTIVLLSPAGTPIMPGDPKTGVESQGPYFAEFGLLGEAGGPPAPGPETIWTAPAGAKLTTATPVTLTFDDGAGLTFRRTIAVDDKYMFTVTDAIENKTGSAVKLTPYGRVARLGEVHTAGYYILHEGLIGVFGDQGLEQYTYKNLIKTPEFKANPAQSGWLGITGKYWAAALVPEKGRTFTGRYTLSQQQNGAGPTTPLYQADFQSEALSVPAGGTAEARNMMFAGAKQVAVVNGYRNDLGIERFDLLIDWGWFYFITKPMFFVIDWFYHLLGNFGLAILAVTVCVKLVFFPLANKSYKSMSGMKKVQPQMQ